MIRFKGNRLGKLVTLVAPAAFVLTMDRPATADEAGQSEYLAACAVCHGEQGTGDGPLSDYLTVGVPDLTILARNNGGEFPMLYVIQVIDGRFGMRAHGDARPDAAGNMPVWGDRFEADIAGETGRYGYEMAVRGRILALAEYLKSIQN